MKFHPSFAAISAILACTGPTLATITVPALFSDHAVLQKAAAVPIWGSGDPGEKVSVILDNVRAHAVTGADGRWQVDLNLKEKGPGPYILSIEGTNKLTFTDIAVGEVWICSGQSNMEWPLKETNNAQTEIAASANPLLRQFLVKKAAVATPSTKLEGRWVCAGPDTSGSFTAVGYYFGKRLNQELRTPIGLIHTSWGGTPSEAWTSPGAIASVPELMASKERQFAELAAFPEKSKRYHEWLIAHGRKDAPTADLASYLSGPNGQDWNPITLPGTIAGDKIAKTGAIWVRCEVEVAEGWKGKAATFECDPISGADTVFWNGLQVGETRIDRYVEGAKRRYTIPAELVIPGRASLAIRIFAPLTTPVVAGSPGSIKVNWKPLLGDWFAKTEFALPDLEADLLAAAPLPPKQPWPMQFFASTLFNGMVNPLLPYGIKGVIWYQGETNAGRAYQYRTAFPLLIKDWRAQWNRGDFPFYYCQLANHLEKKAEPSESGWAELREAQAMTLGLPHTGMAVLIDLGESKSIHPRNKAGVGERLARIALARDYGRKIEFQGPMYEAMRIEGNKIRIKFNYTAGGLVAKQLPDTYLVTSSPLEQAPLVKPSQNSEIQGFAIRGNDRTWKWARARIQGNEVVVWSDEVSAPVAVRYAWADNPTCNLYNSAGLPAAPFRTDDSPPITINNKF